VDRGKVRLWYPDFVLPRYGVIIECVGVNGDEAYREGVEHKRKTYADLGLSAMFLWPESFEGNWPRRVMMGIEGIVCERAREFRWKVERGLRGPLRKSVTS